MCITISKDCAIISFNENTEPMIQILKKFRIVDLKKVKKVSRFERTDTKFLAHVDFLPIFLNYLKDDFTLLSVCDKLIAPYYTIYFDDIERSMYREHHNKNTNRYKIRHRNYILKKDSFLEIKVKTNKRKTIKKRININNKNINEQKTFLISDSRYDFKNIIENIRTKYERITLYTEDFSEKVTIDINLSFEKDEKSISIKNIMVIELKQDRLNRSVVLKNALKHRGVHQTSFSKYCMANVMLNPNLRKNRFKKHILLIKKIQKESDIFSTNKQNLEN